MRRKASRGREENGREKRSEKIIEDKKKRRKRARKEGRPLRGTTRNKRVVNERAEASRCEKREREGVREKSIYYSAMGEPRQDGGQRDTYKTNEDNKSAYDD